MKQKVKIKLANGIEIIMDEQVQNDELMVAIGMMISMLGVAEKEFNKLEKEKFKSMMNMYIDTIWK